MLQLQDSHNCQNNIIARDILLINFHVYFGALYQQLLKQ